MGDRTSLIYWLVLGSYLAGLITGSAILASVVLSMLPVPAFVASALASHTPAMSIQRAAAIYLAGQPHGTVAAAEVGTLGFYSGDAVIDMLGLVSPEVVSHMAQRDYVWILKRDRPRYVFVWGEPRGAPCAFEVTCAVWASFWFRQHYREIWRHPFDQRSNYDLLVYK